MKEGLPMAENEQYWRGRFSILEEAARRDAKKRVEELETIYRDAERRVQADLERWYGWFASNNGISLTDARKMLTSGQMEEFRWTVEQYIKAGQHANLSSEWLKKLENASARFRVSRLETIQLQIQQQMELLYGGQLDSLDRLLRKVISNGYTHTAFEIQKGLGLGWDITALNQQKLETLLSKPWTADGKTFRDRCWENKANLVSGVQSTLTQGILRGDSLQKITDNIKKQFGISRYKACRLAYTETTYFNGAANLEVYRDLGVEQIEILETLDQHTCEVCGALDGKVIPLSQYEPGVTVPPFHPNCRGTTCPHYEDMAGERAARKADGEVYHIPDDMTYEEWKKGFMEGEKSRFSKIFQPMENYHRKDGSFDLEAAKEDYRKFLQTVPDEYRMYLEQSLDAVEFEEIDRPDVVFGYDGKNDRFVYNSSDPSFYDYDFRVVATHELAHRVDQFFVQSWEQEMFSKAIADAQEIVAADPEKFLEFAKNDADGFLSDIFSAICEDNYRFDTYHEKIYWLKPGNKEKEIFANLFSLETFNSKEQLDFLEEAFPNILSRYREFWG